MGFVQRAITKMANKMAAFYQFASILWCAHSNLVIFNLISFKFQIWLASIKLWFKFKYGFNPTKMVNKIAATYQFALEDTLP